MVSHGDGIQLVDDQSFVSVFEKDSNSLWKYGFLFSGLGAFLVYKLTPAWDGPAFFMAYIVILVGLLIIKSITIKLDFLTKSQANVFFLLLFEIIGITRIIFGYSQGMHRYSNLFLLMIVGGIFLGSDVKSKGDSSTGGWGGLGCGSSCSGGCGGGCGGCGGCGG